MGEDCGRGESWENCGEEGLFNTCQKHWAMLCEEDRRKKNAKQGNEKSESKYVSPTSTVFVPLDPFPVSRLDLIRIPADPAWDTPITRLARMKYFTSIGQPIDYDY